MGPALLLKESNSTFSWRVELGLLGVSLLAHLVAADAEDIGQTGQPLLFPALDMGWMDAEHLGDLGGRLVRLDGLHGDSGL